MCKIFTDAIHMLLLAGREIIQFRHVLSFRMKTAHESNPKLYNYKICHFNQSTLFLPIFKYFVQTVMLFEIKTTANFIP